MIGTLLSNRYRIEAKVGEGGMGVVYRAHDTLLDRPVAIKTLSPSLLGEEGTKRLMREAQSAAKLTHPNIVSTYDVIEEADARLIVMEYVEGRTLRDLIPLPWAQAAQIVAQVCRALEYAHARGIVHRDIKPENIIFTADGIPKVMDFGLARSEGRSRLTQTGMLVGTVAYMAPEQALRGEADARSDLYALGCVLYEAITGHPPFEAEDPIAVITQHINIPPVAPRFHTPGIPDTLERVILKLLAKDPDARYRSARDVALALEAVHESAIQAAPQPKVAGPELVQAVRRGVLVGRDEELRRLKGLLDEAASGEGRLVLIAGEAGVGKTRLVEELITYAHLRGVRVFAAKCYEGGTPYEPVIRILREYLRSAPADEVRDALGDYAADLARLTPEVRQKLGSLPEAIPLPPEQERARLFESVTKLLTTLARSAPLLLFIDDLHLADTGTLALFRYLAPAVAGERLLISAAYRTEETDRTPSVGEVLRQFRRERYAVPLEVKPLTQPQVVELIRVMANHPTTPTRFASRIFEVTEGNSLFIEEVINTLFEQGTLYIKDGQWSTDFDEGARYAEMPVPETIRTTIETRLNRLSDACRQALTQAAVLGKRFGLDALAKVTEKNEDELLGLLEEALSARLLREVRVAGEDYYEFAQSMVREVIYEGISRHRRRRMHLRTGEALEEIYRGRRIEKNGEIADHFLEAGEEERAIPYLVEAGEQAEALFSHDEAIRRYETARELLEDAGQTEEVMRLLERLGEPYLHAGHWQKAIDCYQRALSYHEAKGQRLKVADLRRKIGHVYQINWDFTAAIPVLEQALQEFGDAGGHDVLLLYLDLARAYNFAGQPERGLEWGRKALELATTLGAGDEAAAAHGEIGLASQSLMRMSEAVEHYRDAIRLAQPSRTHLGKFAFRRSINNLGALESTRGDYRAELEHRREALRLAEEVRVPFWIRFQLDGVAYALWQLGEWQEARATYDRIVALVGVTIPSHPFASAYLLHLDERWEDAIERWKAIYAEVQERADAQGMLIVSQRFAEASIMLGRYEEAEQYARQGIALPFPAPFWTLPDVLNLLAESLARQGRVGEAAEVSDKAEEISRAIDGKGVLGSVHYVRGLIAAARGERDQARREFEEAIQIYNQFPRPFEQARVFEDLGALDRETNPAVAADAYAKALAIYERLGARRSAVRISELLGRLEATHP